jgi:predicted amidohydrolase
VFPGTAWLGLIATAILPTACVLAPRRAIPPAALAVVVSNALWHAPQPPKGWEAVNTNLGAISHGQATPEVKFSAMNWLQDRALRSGAHVLVFPETVIPMWTEATELFWQQTLADLRASGKTIVIGAGIPTRTAPDHVDFSAELAALRDKPVPVPDTVQHETPAYLNAALIRGTETGTFLQRIPVPLGMWRPFGRGGVPLNIARAGVIEIAGQRAAIWICYEQLLVWPVLESMVEGPSVIVAMANDHWVTGTPISQWQRTIVSAWARLFNLPYISAVNK